MTASQNRRTIEKIIIFISYVAITIGVFAAHLSPLRGYELSIYEATPTIFWGGMAVALTGAVVGSVLFVAPHRRLASVVAGVTSIVLIALLPYIRSYWFYGRFDAFRHLGTAKIIMERGEAPRTLIYPAMHVLGIVIKVTGNITTPKSLGLLPAVFVLLFVLTIPLATKLLTADIKPEIPILSGMLLLPILTIKNPVLQPVPTTLAILFLPLPIYLLLQHTSRQSRKLGIPLVLSLTMLVLLHPQHATAFFLLLITLLVIQTADYLLGGTRISESTKSVFVPTVVLGVVLISWTTSNPVFQGAVSGLLSQLLSNPEVGQGVGHKGMALQKVGGGILEIFLKVFLVKFLFVCLTVGIILTRAYEWVSEHKSRRDTVVLLIAVGLVPVSWLFLLYVMISFPGQYFRYLGFLLVFGTIFGAIASHVVQPFSVSWASTLSGRHVVTLVFLLSVLLSVPAFYQSPYIYRPSGGMPEQHSHGFSQTFEHNATPLATLSNPARDYVYTLNAGRGDVGIETKEFEFEGFKPTRVPWHFANQTLDDEIRTETYLTVTSYDRRKYADLFRGVHYSSDDFEYLDSDPQIAKVQSNNGYDLYLIYPEETDTSSTEPALAIHRSGNSVDSSLRSGRFSHTRTPRDVS